MKKIFFAFVILLTLHATGAVAQWRVIKSFEPPNSDQLSDIFIQSIYFLDLPGPPRIGFMGIKSTSSFDTTTDEGGAVWKTSDGGSTWHQVGPVNDRGFFGPGVDDFTFKDSITGWLAAGGWSGGGGCYKTIDGGETWKRLPGRDDPCLIIYYHSATDRLFLSDFLGFGPLTSQDEGNTWNTFNNRYFTGCAFADDTIGILCGLQDPNKNTSPSSFNSFTTDGGATWTYSNVYLNCWHPVAIKGTHTFFALADTSYYTDTTWLYRSDDGGRIWSQISIPPIVWPISSTGSTSTSLQLYGDLQHIFVPTNAGVFVSHDEGYTWESLCAPPSSIVSGSGDKVGFYQKDNYIYTTVFDLSVDNRGVKLWYLNLDSLHIFNSKVISQFADGTKRKKVQTGNTVSVELKQVADTAIGVDTAHFAVRFDSVALNLRALNIPSGWVIIDSSSHSGLFDLWIADTSTEFTLPNVTLSFQTFLVSSSLAKVYLDSAKLYGKWVNCDITAQSLTAPDSVEIDFEGCGDSTLLRYMATGSPFEIESIVPNPARDQIEVRLRVAAVGDLHAAYSLFDALGVEKLRGITEASDLPLDVSSLAAGTYYLRISLGTGEARTIKIVKE